jgi:hypothetical protein
VVHALPLLLLNDILQPVVSFLQYYSIGRKCKCCNYYTLSSIGHVVERHSKNVHIFQRFYVCIFLDLPNILLFVCWGGLRLLLVLFIFCTNLANWISCYSHDRTKEQLGYTVDSSPRMTYRLLAYCFRVMSSKYSPVYLQSRIDDFIDGVSTLLVRFYPTSHFCVSPALPYCFAPDRKCRLINILI